MIGAWQSWYECAPQKMWRNLESRINQLKRDYTCGARNLNEYLDAMTHIVRSVM